jgi:hypothetical protein
VKSTKQKDIKEKTTLGDAEITSATKPAGHFGRRTGMASLAVINAGGSSTASCCCGGMRLVPDLIPDVNDLPAAVPGQ